jgi:hypothetical protein
LKELGIITTSKPFLDSNWQEMWARFYMVNNFFRALVGNNNGKFKTFFAEFVPLPIERMLTGEGGNMYDSKLDFMAAS